jgi:hypothetical protein
VRSTFVVIAVVAGLSCSHAPAKEPAPESSAQASSSAPAPGSSSGVERHAGETPQSPPQPLHPGEFKNLKVLPQDIQRKELMGLMRTMSRSLGVRCNFCHVMEPERDFVADTPKKETARTMLRMVNALNTQYLTWQTAPKATCYMCHRGNHVPVTQLPPEDDGQPATAPAAQPSSGS